MGLRKVIDDCPHLFGDPTLPELITKFFEFAFILPLFLRVELLWRNKSGKHVFIYVFISEPFEVSCFRLLARRLLVQSKRGGVLDDS